MSKRKKPKIMSIDFQFGVDGIIPATQEAFTDNSFDSQKRKIEGTNLKEFKTTFISKLSESLSKRAKELNQFPTKKEVFLFILQYFSAKKEYVERDVDNIAKTILDTLKKSIYSNDNQVKYCLVGKKIDKRIPQDFAYIAIKELKNENDPIPLKLAGSERAIQFFNEVKQAPD